MRICSLKNEALGRFEDIWDHQRLDRKSTAKLVYGLREVAEIVSVGDQSLESELGASQHFQSQPECVPGKEDSLNTNFLSDGVGLRKTRLTGIVQAPCRSGPIQGSPSCAPAAGTDGSRGPA